MGRRKIIVIVSCLVLAIGLVAGGIFLKSISDYKKKVASITFSNIDITRVKDGTYVGECDTGVVNATVQVTIQDHQLTEIKLLEHNNGKGAPAEVILDQMVEKQTTQIDAVSGATSSSIVLRKAVENALSQGI